MRGRVVALMGEELFESARDLADPKLSYTGTEVFGWEFRWRSRSCSPRSAWC
jgi:hypothetical protein